MDGVCVFAGKDGPESDLFHLLARQGPLTGVRELKITSGCPDVTSNDTYTDETNCWTQWQDNGGRVETRLLSEQMTKSLRKYVREKRD